MSSLGSLPRPGIELGLYPESGLPKRTPLEKMVRSGMAPVARRLRRGGSELKRAVRLVNSLATTYEAMSDLELRAAARQAGIDMRRMGLEDDLMIQAFAIVREASTRSLGMRHFDVQIMGGWAMARGMIAEMQTGEGKTLTATLPACTAALAGIPVHVITVNDYLVTRDAEAMKPLYEFVGLSVGTIVEELSPEERRVEYGCDVTYCTNKQVAFDYLKDRVLLGQKRSNMQLELETLYSENPRSERLLLRGLCFAIVDEADSVMIDEAQTPLILSAQEDDGVQTDVYSQALKFASGFEIDKDFEIDRFHRLVEITPSGRERIDEMALGLSGPWASSKFRLELVAKALSALHCFVRDEHYLVDDEKVKIIDEFTGRVMADRTWEHGLHQMVEVKEGCEASSRRKTIARVSYQRFFRRYLRLSGMTGTASSAAAELWSIYSMKVSRIPTNRPGRRQVSRDRMFGSADAKWRAIVARIREMYETGRPVLVGTRSVANSEILSSALTRAGIEHVVLNARQDSEEAEIVARAGMTGTITVATNMAGRGTDIKLAPGVVESGGLHVLAAERNESARIDRQLFGRCGRQGDLGSAEALIALEDEVFERYCPASLRKVAQLFCRGHDDRIPPEIASIIVRWSQRAAERRGVALRKQLLNMDEHLDNVLAFSGQPE
jgi:preprotein translocase subunit SecA